MENVNKIAFNKQQTDRETETVVLRENDEKSATAYLGLCVVLAKTVLVSKAFSIISVLTSSV